MVLSNPVPEDDGSEWEYEYDDTATETFFLNIDLTTYNGPLRPPRRRNEPNEPSASISRTSVPTPAPTATPSHSNAQDPTSLNGPEIESGSADRVQILGLHTPNPIISHQNQIFSGSWADQLGTELIFAPPGATTSEFDEADSTAAHVTPLKHTKDFDLIAANSVKILARKANLISSSGPGAAAPQPQPQAQVLQQWQPQNLTSTLTPGLSGLVYKPEHQTNQAKFLERLKEVKRRKGETDNVRTVFSSARRGPTLEDRLRGWVKTDEQLATIQHLNERALQGDSDAIAELENLYSQLGNSDAGSSETPSRSV
ncbi:hypothetical protein ASPCAL05512 [Aspergillus calidoustus]|uniref:Transcription factor TFIIIC triple barrel domain-containing protein n=1 Tax=Aspergillus calidoustus TaxID=454130 RepID=A0A0U5G130_ASPCI|nr:hypothetical protein ASPCAL05512 [Aspergillus calidoustus]